MLVEVNQDSSFPSQSDQQQVLNELIQQQIQQLTLTNRIYSEICKTLDLNEMLANVCRLLGQAVNCDRIRILIAESDNQDVLMVRGEYQADISPGVGVRVFTADHPHLQALINSPSLSEIVWSSGSLRQDAAGTAAEWLDDHYIGWASPLVYQGQFHGVVEFIRRGYFPEDGNTAYWTHTEQQLITEVIQRLTAAIDQAKCHEAVQHQMQRESLLRLITNQIHRTLDLDVILQTAVQEVRRFLKTDRVLIYQFGEQWQGKVVIEEVGEGWQSTLGDFSQDNCFSADYARLYEGGRVRAIDNILEAGLDSCHVEFLQRLQVKANLIVPILTGGKLWGLLLAHECCNPRAWQTWEAELLRQIATQMAIAIQQAELYAQVQASATQAQSQTQQLQDTLDELKNTQMQLVQTEKLSSLGQMVAGVAHEINNAINFIHANLPYAQSYADALEQTVRIYESHYPQPAAIAELNASVELDYVRQDFPKLLQSMKEGTKRVREIVLTLRNFSRVDESNRKPINLHEGLESTLLILQHRMKAGAKVIKQYGQIPLVECHAGQINQVFLNILSNALDAAGNQAEITIKTWSINSNWVGISIADNGPGIPADIQARIFDPFFTTKEIGQGTGLGLSICYQIICQGHGGQIRCISQPGQGTEFRIELPVSNAA
ncbi:MAG TPA: GAF domain-containing protein [Crinalium sp.]|jgi:signal transduction histidine kinase